MEEISRERGQGKQKRRYVDFQRKKRYCDDP